MKIAADGFGADARDGATRTAIGPVGAMGHFIHLCLELITYLGGRENQAICLLNSTSFPFLPFHKNFDVFSQNKRFIELGLSENTKRQL